MTKKYPTDGKYILDEQGNPVPCYDLYEWGDWMQTHDRMIASTIVGEYRVSTVFLGLDYSFGGEPQLYETMVFEVKESTDEYNGKPYTFHKDMGIQYRYSTKEQALKGHEEAIVEAKNL